MYIGAAYLDVAGSLSKDPHLWVVCTRPNRDDEVVVVCFVSSRPGTPQVRTCVMDVGDHPFITHETVADYPTSKVQTLRDLRVAITAGRLVARADASSQLLVRLRDGALESNRTPRMVQQLIRACWWAPD